MNDEKYIDELVRKFFDVDITTEEMDYLYSYFLSLTTIPPKWKDDAPIIRAFAIMRYCKTTEAEFRQSLKAARQTAETRKRFAPKLVLRIAAAAACVAAIAVGFWKISTDAVPTMPTYDMLQPTQVAQAEVPAKQQTLEISTTAPTYPATTDNEIKNTTEQTAYKHTETMYAEHKSDIDEMSDILFDNTAAAAIAEQEPQPILLAEAESRIHAEPIYNNLEMYCNTKCLSNEVSVAYFDVTGENFI